MFCNENHVGENKARRQASEYYFRFMVGAAILVMAVLATSCSTMTARPSSQQSERPSAIAEQAKDVRIVLPVCNCEEYISDNESIIVRLRWGAKTKGLAEKGANSLVYTTTIDDTVVGGFHEWRKPAIFVPRSAYGQDAWWVFWDYALGKLPIGDHMIRAVATPDATLFDGWVTFQKGKSEEFHVIIHVRESIPDGSAF